MLERFIQSINPSNILELVFELIWDKYMDDDIASVIDIPAWETIDTALCTLARRIREEHPERRLSVILSVVAPQSTDLQKVKMGTLFNEFRKEGSISMQCFIDYLPPVSLPPAFAVSKLTVCSIGRILLRYASIGSGQMIQNQTLLSRFSKKKKKFHASCSPVILLFLAILEA